MHFLVLQLGLGVVLLLVSTRVLVTLAIRISAALRISPLIVGTTIVALGTSLPELAVSGVASARQDIGLALGNIIGSNIVNIIMVLPVGILIGKLRIGTTKTQRNALLLLAVTAVFIVLHMVAIGTILMGLILIILALLVTVVEYKWAVFGRDHEDFPKLKKFGEEKFSLGRGLGLAASVVGIIAGGVLVVAAVEGISTLTGYSTTILGLSLTAIATSLPELLTTVFSQEKNQEKITLGNIIGSNIYNLLFVGGVIAFFPINVPVQTRDWGALVLATVCFVVVLTRYKGKRVPRRVGLVLLMFLVVYLYTLSISK